jgi:hypothetical protein
MRFDATVVSNLLLTCTLFTLTITFLTGNTMFGMNYSSFCLLCSGLWLICMGRQLPELLTDFVDTRKQRRLIISLACGTSATILAFAPASQVLQNALATLALIGWIFLIREGAQTRNQYQKVERGLLPLDTWLDPPANVFQAGDVIGTTGAWWEPHHQAFAHCELISATTESGIIANKAMSKNEWTSYLEARQGELLCASSC